MRIGIIAVVMVVLFSGIALAESGAGKADKAKACCANPTATCAEKAIPAKLNKLLDRIESTSVKLRSFEADMLYIQEQLLQETITRRTGKVYYRVDDDAVRARIAYVDFLQRYSDEAPPKPQKFDEDIVFDGMWVIHRNARTKNILRKQVSRTPKNVEAFRLGKGEFPLPLAIRKADVLREFDVTWPRPDPNDPEDTDHLLLKPKEKSSYAKKYARIELWIGRKLIVPTQIRFETHNHEITTFTWSKIKLNKRIKDKVFELKGGRGWSEEEQPLREEDVSPAEGP